MGLTGRRRAGAFAEMVRVHRRRQSLTQEELAGLTGLSVRGIGKLEAGQIVQPRATTVRLLADALGLAGTDRDAFCRAAVDPAGSPPGPSQLPADPAWFTGRRSDLALLDTVLRTAGGTRTAMAIATIGGSAGTGKTALAVHWAHRVASRFPDGQLFIDLHGFTRAAAPVDPADALERLLRSLGIPGERIPAELDDRAALWRSVLARRRMLLLLDNAATHTQLMPLLPGAPTVLVLITSRRRLTGIHATHTITVDTLPRTDAITLFTRTIGAGRVDPPNLAAEAVELCGRLPLAIRVAGARLRSRPAWGVADLVDRLRDHENRLAELSDEDASWGVAAALDVSYQQLSGDQQRLYRRLGLHPGPDLDAYAAAALAGSSVAAAGRSLDQLLDAHLLQELSPGRYARHDLIRAHAGATAATEPKADREAALRRLLDYYQHTAAAAMDLAYPYEHEQRPQVPAAATAVPSLPDPAAATRWLDAELPNLLAAARHAADHGWPRHLLNLSSILHRHLRARGRYHDAETLHRDALTTARALGDRDGEARLATLHRR